jgi:hypothetical protein
MHTKTIQRLVFKINKDGFISKANQFLCLDTQALAKLQDFLLIYFELLIVSELELVAFSTETIDPLIKIRNTCMWERGKSISPIAYVDIEEKQQVISIHSLELLNHVLQYVRYEISIAALRVSPEPTLFSNIVPLEVTKAECLMPFVPVDTKY